MRRMNLLALLLTAATFANAEAQSLRSGGCSDLYGTAPTSQAGATEEVSDRAPRARLISTGAKDDGSVHYTGLFHKGGCSGGSCFAPMQVGAAYQAPAVNYYAAPSYAAPRYVAPNYNAQPYATYSSGVYASPAATYQGPIVAAASSSGCGACGNAVVAYGNTIQSSVAQSGAVMVPTEQRNLIDCGPINSYKVVLEPKYFTESRAVATTEYQNETRLPHSSGCSNSSS